MPNSSTYAWYTRDLAYQFSMNDKGVPSFHDLLALYKLYDCSSRFFMSIQLLLINCKKGYRLYP